MQKPSTKESHMRLDYIRLQNFRCFESRELELAPRFNLIIGDNATGKTTLLDGMAIGLGSLFLGFPEPATTLSISKDQARLRFFEQGGVLTAEPQFPVVVASTGQVDGKAVEWCRDLSSDEGRTTRQFAGDIQQIAADMHQRVSGGDASILPIISFYGTGRLWLQKRLREVETLAPNTRFMGYLSCLEPASDGKRLLQWFKTYEIAALQRGQPFGMLEACRRAIVSCVPDATRVYFDIARDELMIDLPQKTFPFSYLSDGFRNMMGMVADIAVRCATLNPHLGEDAARQTPGVVLIDEIDLHLHPKWQRSVVEDLLNAFPNIQFVATSHSPFVIQSLPPINGVQLINLDNPEADGFANKSVEDITEEVQGVVLPQRTQRYLDMFNAAEEYYRILGEVPNASPEEKNRLSEELDRLIMPYSDDPAYQAFLNVQREAAGLNGKDKL
jgi:predicted ATP-binding protein involved in virulence